MLCIKKGTILLLSIALNYFTVWPGFFVTTRMETASLYLPVGMLHTSINAPLRRTNPACPVQQLQSFITATILHHLWNLHIYMKVPCPEYRAFFQMEGIIFEAHNKPFPFSFMAVGFKPRCR